MALEAMGLSPLNPDPSALKYLLRYTCLIGYFPSNELVSTYMRKEENLYPVLSYPKEENPYPVHSFSVIS